MRPRWARSVPEPLIELGRPLVLPDPEEREREADLRATSGSPFGSAQAAARVAARRLSKSMATRPAWSHRLRTAEQELTKLLDIGRHGSYTPGRLDWAHRWSDPTRPRVLQYAFKDYAGSQYDWTRSINETTEWSARHAVVETSRFGFPTDLVYPHPDRSPDLTGLFSLADEADVIHVKDEFAFSDPVRRAIVERLRATGKPVIFTQYGGVARSLQDDRAYREYVGSFDAHVALTADLCFAWLGAQHVPHVTPTVAGQRWSDGLCIAHSPSTPERKGTDLLIAAVETARSLVPGLYLDLISGVSVEESVRRKETAALFFDQAGREIEARLGTDRIIGWYGKSAVEAMAAGVPVIAHLKAEARAAAGPVFNDGCPIIDVEPTVEAISDAIVGYFQLGADERRRHSDDTLTWVREFHGERRVGQMLTEVYERSVKLNR